jgi:DNA-binding response OmpR family regulator
LGTRTVLIVEDNADVRRMLSLLFDRAGWGVRSAGTVAEALGMVEPPADSAVVDLGLPDGDGEDVVRTLRASAPATRVVVYSAYLRAGDTRSERLRALGAATVPKPAEFAAILAACDG